MAAIGQTVAGLAHCIKNVLNGIQGGSFMPDLVILDVQMPGKGGFDVFAEMKQDEASADIPVIMLTGVAEKTGMAFSSQEMGDFLGREPDAYIEKPVDPATLQQTVSRVLGL